MRLCNYTDVYKNDAIVEELPFMAATASKGEIERFKIRVGDTLLTKDSESADDIGITAFVEYQAEDLICGYHLSIVRPRLSAIHPKFLFWSLSASPVTRQWAVLASGVTRVGLRAGDLSRVTVALPPGDEQRAIADYLDRETARIDTLVEEQQQLIGLLGERRWAAVERSVALLDWNTPLRSVATLIQTGPFGSQLKSEEYEDGGTAVINPSHLVAGEIVPDHQVAVGASKSEQLARHRLEEGDIVAARRGELGRCAVVGSSAVGFLCGTGSAIIRLDRTRVDSDFVAMVFGSRRNRETLALVAVGSTMPNLNSSSIGALRIPVLALDDQRLLRAEVRRSIAKIDEMIDEAEQFIKIAQERRGAIITAAVTGQIDVREMA